MNYDDLDTDWKYERKVAAIQAEEHVYTKERERKKIDNRARYTNLTRRLHEQRIEDDFFDKNTAAAESELRYQERVQKDLVLAKEIDQQKNAAMIDIKMRQLIRQNAPELRELESKLRTAYITKELEAQLAEKAHKKLLEKHQQKVADELASQALLNTLQAERRESEENRKKQFQYKKDLQDQMILNHQMKENVYEEFLKEKKYIDYIIQRIYDEDQREIEHKMCKMRKTREEIEYFKQAQEVWKQRQKEEIQAENERIKQYIREKEAKDKARINERIAKEEKHQQLTEKLGKKIFEENKQRSEREAFVQDLYEEELKQKDIDKREREFRRKIQERIEIKQVLAVQREERKKREERDKLEDIQYKEQLWAKMAEEKKVEQLSAEKRRRKMIEIRHEIEDAMVERRAKRAEEIKQLIYLQEQDKITEEKKKKIIEEERIKMLKEHAVNLIGYLPRGVLREDDITFLGSDVMHPNKVKC